MHSNFATWNRGIVGGLDVGSSFFSVLHFSGTMIETYIALEKPMRIMFYKGQNYIQIIVIPKPPTFNCVLDPVPFTAETSSFDFLILYLNFTVNVHTYIWYFAQLSTRSHRFTHSAYPNCKKETDNWYLS